MTGKLFKRGGGAKGAVAAKILKRGGEAKKAVALTLGNILPSFITLCSGAAGMSAILWASRGSFGRAVLLVLLAAICDGLDGRLARMFKSASQFGVELDSLVDSLSFGVAPAFIMYFFAANEIKGFGWVAAIVLAASCILRLARFNVMTGDKKAPEYWSHFFMGMPAPAGGLMALFPIVLLNATGIEFFRSPYFAIPIMLFVAFMMVSTIPTLSLKKVKISKEAANYLLLLFVLIAMLFMFYFWRTFMVMGLLYLATIPLTAMRFIRMRREAEAGK